MATLEERGLFQPMGDMSESDRVVLLMVDTPVGGVITYEDLDRVLGRPFREVRVPFYTALERFHREHSERGTFRNVPNVGYERVVDFEATTSIAKGRRKRARKQLRKSRAVLGSTDRSGMTMEERQELNGLIERTGRLEREFAIHRRHVDEVRERAATTERRQDATEKTVDEMRQLIEEQRSELALIKERIGEGK